MTIWFLFQVNRGNGSPPWVSQIKVKVEPSCTGSLTLSSALPCSERTNGGEEGTAIKHVHQQNVQGKSELINLGISKLEDENSLIQNLQHKRFQKPFLKWDWGNLSQKLTKAELRTRIFLCLLTGQTVVMTHGRQETFFFPSQIYRKRKWNGWDIYENCLSFPRNCTMCEIDSSRLV